MRLLLWWSWHCIATITSDLATTQGSGGRSKEAPSISGLCQCWGSRAALKDIPIGIRTLMTLCGTRTAPSHSVFCPTIAHHRTKIHWLIECCCRLWIECHCLERRFVIDLAPDKGLTLKVLTKLHADYLTNQSTPFLSLPLTINCKLGWRKTLTGAKSSRPDTGTVLVFFYKANISIKFLFFSSSSKDIEMIRVMWIWSHLEKAFQLQSELWGHLATNAASNIGINHVIITPADIWIRDRDINAMALHWGVWHLGVTRSKSGQVSNTGRLDNICRLFDISPTQWQL